MKFFEFLSEFKDDRSLVDKLRRIGLLRTAITCDVCGDLMDERIVNKTDGSMFFCSRRACRKAKSIRHGSFFEGSKLSLFKSMLFLHLWSKGYSEKLIIEDFDFSIRTAVDWARYCRDLCVFELENSEMMIGGPGCTVEIDETFAVKRKYNQGRTLAAGWLFGGIERRNDGDFRCFMRFIYDRSEAHLTHLIQQHVHMGTHIITDGWSSYRNLSQHGYIHSVVIHGENFVSPDDNEVHTQSIESTWSSLKRFIRSRGTNKGEYYLEYIAEYLFRRKHKNVYDSLLDAIRRKYNLN